MQDKTEKIEIHQFLGPMKLRRLPRYSPKLSRAITKHNWIKITTKLNVMTPDFKN